MPANIFCDSIKFVEDKQSHYQAQAKLSKKLFSCHFPKNVQVIKHKLFGRLAQRMLGGKF